MGKNKIAIKVMNLPLSLRELLTDYWFSFACLFLPRHGEAQVYLGGERSTGLLIKEESTESLNG